MKITKLFLSCLIFVSGLSFAADPKEVFWEDLMPKGYIEPTYIPDHSNPMAQQSLDAPLVDTFNNQKVKIPGFVVPLEGDGRTTTEFLLVPFFGACIHVPPPPPNQIVYVKFSEGVPIINLSDAVWVIGVLTTQGWSGEIATVGYSMDGLEVLPFDG